MSSDDQQTQDSVLLRLKEELQGVVESVPQSVALGDTTLVGLLT